MLHLDENIEEQINPTEEIINEDNYLTTADVRSLIDESTLVDNSVVAISSNITSTINSLNDPSYFKDMIKEAVKEYMEEMKNAAS